MSFRDWILENWLQIAAIFGVGGGGVLGNKILRKKREEKMKELETSVDIFQSRLISIGKDLEHNTAHVKELKSEIKKIRDTQSKIYVHLLKKNT